MTFSETEKLESHPVYVYIERVSISPTKESQKQSGIKEFSNTREYKYTVVADQRNQFKFEITLLMDKDERAASCLINSVSNDSVWIEVELSMISKAGVETNCKCRSFLTTYGYSKNHNTNSGPYNYFISRDIKDKYGAPMLFWYSSKKINLDQLDILKLSESGNSKSDTSDMM